MDGIHYHPSSLRRAAEALYGPTGAGWSARTICLMIGKATGVDAVGQRAYCGLMPCILPALANISARSKRMGFLIVSSVAALRHLLPTKQILATRKSSESFILAHHLTSAKP